MLTHSQMLSAAMVQKKNSEKYIKQLKESIYHYERLSAKAKKSKEGITGKSYAINELRLFEFKKFLKEENENLQRIEKKIKMLENSKSQPTNKRK
jgi:hypothetical protein